VYHIVIYHVKQQFFGHMLLVLSCLFFIYRAEDEDRFV
jgi:hypothetical protein